MTHDIGYADIKSGGSISKPGRPSGSKNRPKPLYEGDGGVAGAKLLSYIERIERLDTERLERAEDIKDVYVELYGDGFDKAAVREIVKMRKLDPSERQEKDAILDTYLAALGMI